MKIYVAASWRNEKQPEVVKQLREAGYDVYDYRNPTDTDRGFHWRQIDPNWESWTAEQFRESLDHPLACTGFKYDFDAMKDCDACVFLMPSGFSGHLEAGWFVGAGKPCIILIDDGRPELMYKMATAICVSMGEVIAKLKHVEEGMGPNMTPVNTLADPLKRRAMDDAEQCIRRHYIAQAIQRAKRDLEVRQLPVERIILPEWTWSLYPDGCETLYGMKLTFSDTLPAMILTSANFGRFQAIDELCISEAEFCVRCAHAEPTEPDSPKEHAPSKPLVSSEVDGLRVVITQEADNVKFTCHQHNVLCDIHTLTQMELLADFQRCISILIKRVQVALQDPNVTDDAVRELITRAAQSVVQP